MTLRAFSAVVWCVTSFNFDGYQKMCPLADTLRWRTESKRTPLSLFGFCLPKSDLRTTVPAGTGEVNGFLCPSVCYIGKLDGIRQSSLESIPVSIGPSAFAVRAQTGGPRYANHFATLWEPLLGGRRVRPRIAGKPVPSGPEGMPAKRAV